MLSTQADFPFFNDCTAASTSLRRMGWSSSVSVLVQFSTDGSPLALYLYSSEQYSVHRFSMCRSSVRHFPELSWTVVAFPFHSGQVFHQLVCPLTVVLPQILPIQFSLAFFIHHLMLLFTSLYFSDPSGSNLFFLSSLLFSHSSRISAVIQGFFLLTMFAKDLTGCSSHRCVEGGDH